MGDDDLRTLERLATTSRDPALCRRLARAFERAGQPREAHRALLLGADALENRKEASRARLAPIRAAPRVRWEMRPDERDQVTAFLANPLAVIAGTGQRTLVLDPLTGAIKKQLLPCERPQLCDEVLLLLLPTLVLAGYDAWSGEELFAKRIQGTQTFASATARLFVTGWGRDVHAYAFADPRREPELAWRWRTSSSAAVGPPSVSDRLVVLPDGEVLTALDAATGAELWSARNEDVAALDAHGLVTVATLRLRGRSLDGRVTFERPGALFFAASETHVLAKELMDARGLFSVIDRATGATVSQFDTSATQAAFVSDVLYLASALGGAIEARGLDGRVLWTWTPEPAPTKLRFVPGPWCVHVLAGTRAIGCLEAP